MNFLAFKIIRIVFYSILEQRFVGGRVFPETIWANRSAFARMISCCGEFTLTGVESDFSLETSGSACHFSKTICAQAIGHFFS
jgi:hypothetical protein